MVMNSSRSIDLQKNRKQTMTAQDPLRRLCLDRLRNIPVQLACIIAVVAQATLINDHLVQGHSDKTWWAWYTADAVAIIALATSFYLREWRVASLYSKHKEQTEFYKGLPLTAISWLIYALLIGIRVAIIFKRDLEMEIDIGSLKITICLTAVVCVFFTAGHHHKQESTARRAAIITMIRTFTIDLLDTVDIMDVLYDKAEENKESFSPALEDVILTITVLNLVIPAVTLGSLFMDHFASKRRALDVKLAKVIVELCVINLPLLVVRVYIAATYDDFISVFLVKNLLAITIGAVEVYDSCYEKRHYEETSVNCIENHREDNSNHNDEPGLYRVTAATDGHSNGNIREDSSSKGHVNQASF